MARPDANWYGFFRVLKHGTETALNRAFWVCVAGHLYHTREMTEHASDNQQGQNRDIEHFMLGTGAVAIEQGFAMAELHQYLQDLALLNHGVPYKELGIWQRRASFAPAYISAEGFATAQELQSGNPIQVGSIALLKLAGVMRADGGISNPGIGQLASDLRAAYDNKSIAGIIIETNSGGGEVLAATILNSALSERNKPVVGFAHMAASAAYWALANTDEIIASGDASEFGSIGVMVTLDKKAMDDYRARFSEFYGATAPNKNAHSRAAFEGDFSLFQTKTDEMTKSFQDAIAGVRPLRGSQTAIKETLSGKMFAATDAKKNGLVDSIGNLRYAVARVKSLKSKYK